MLESRKIALHPEELYRLGYRAINPDLTLLYSSSLSDDFRRPFESWTLHLEETSDAYIELGTGEKFEEICELLMKVKKFPPILVSGEGNDRCVEIHNSVIVLRCGLTEIVESFHLLHELNKRASSRYTIAVHANEKKLEALWNMLMPHETLTSIGFQGKDPSTDFRAMGLLGLDNLFYFCERYPVHSARILVASNQQVSGFLFASVGIHITAYCLRILRTRQLQLVLYTYGSTKEVFHEVYCYLFDSWEAMWVNQKKPPAQSDFNRIFKEFSIKFETHLLQREPVFLKERTKPARIFKPKRD